MLETAQRIRGTDGIKYANDAHLVALEEIGHDATKYDLPEVESSVE